LLHFELTIGEHRCGNTELVSRSPSVSPSISSSTSAGQRLNDQVIDTGFVHDIGSHRAGHKRPIVSGALTGTPS
jgi:hypothetical protein